MSAKSQHNNILLAIAGFIAVIEGHCKQVRRMVQQEDLLIFIFQYWRTQRILLILMLYGIHLKFIHSFDILRYFCRKRFFKILLKIAA